MSRAAITGLWGSLPQLGAADVALAVGLTTWALLAFASRPVGSIVPLLAMTVPLASRRTLPLATFVIVGIGLLGLIYEPVPGIRAFGPLALLSLLVATFSVVAHARHRVAASAAVAMVAVGAAERAHSELPLPAWLVPPVLLGGVWLAARAVRDHSERASGLAEDARRREHESELERQLALQTERERIARELHDIVSHGVSVMVLQAAAARRLAPTDNDGRGELLLGIEDSGRAALTELRRMLDLLQGTDAAPLSPQPGITQLPDLIHGVRAGGLPVDLTVQGNPRVIAPTTELTAYRIVQEALTNALKHGARTGTYVRLRYLEDALEIEVRDESKPLEENPPLTEGRGVLGMRERVALHRGTLDVGLDASGAFAISAHLPLHEPGP